MQRIDHAELKRWMDEGRPFVLLDVLGADAFEELRLPGAVNACVYEVRFSDEASRAAPDKAAAIVVYGSGEGSREVDDAADRLAAAGYGNVRVFAGGRRAWQAAGLPCEGSSPDRPWEPWPARPLADGVHDLDLEKSVVEWVGRNVNGRHHGTLRLKGGSVNVERGAVTRGSFEIDMGTIAVGDLEGEMAQGLIRHLESDDFFAVERFPTARFEITRVAPIDGAAPGQPNGTATGALTLRGNTHELSFPATIAPHGDAGIALAGHFDIDRTRWGVNYGSGKLYHRLGMHLVNDEISLEVRLFSRA